MSVQVTSGCNRIRGPRLASARLPPNAPGPYNSQRQNRDRCQRKRRGRRDRHGRSARTDHCVTDFPLPRGVPDQAKVSPVVIGVRRVPATIKLCILVKSGKERLSSKKLQIAG